MAASGQTLFFVGVINPATGIIQSLSIPSIGGGIFGFSVGNELLSVTWGADRVTFVLASAPLNAISVPQNFVFTVVYT